MILAFIAGLLASKWLETLLVRTGLRLLRDSPTGTKLRKYAHQEGIKPQKFGKVVSLSNLQAVNAFEEGGTLEEMLDRAQPHGSDLP